MFVKRDEISALKHTATALLTCLATDASVEALGYVRAMEETLDGFLSRPEAKEEGLFQVYHHGTDKEVTLPLPFRGCLAEVRELLEGSDGVLAISDLTQDVVKVGLTLFPGAPAESTAWRYNIRPAGYTVPAGTIQVAGRVVEVNDVSVDPDAPEPVAATLEAAMQDQNRLTQISG